MPTLREHLDRIDGAIPAVMSELTAFQLTYIRRVDRLKYWQALESHAEAPADGVDKDPDRLDRSPHYHPDTWDDVALPTVKALMRASLIKIHIYHGPQGHGFIAAFCVKWSTAPHRGIWEKKVNVGPESYRDMDWTKQDDLV